MRREQTLEHEFVEFIPDILRNETLYVSIGFATVVHKCCCGCGKEVVTPLSPTDWKLTFDGQTISLDPSIGNWSFKCQSHYWIRGNRVKWAPRWSKEQIAVGRNRDLAAKQRGDRRRVVAGVAVQDDLGNAGSNKGSDGRWPKFKKWWRRPR
jgi:Family of unknown function (DUF6527)